MADEIVTNRWERLCAERGHRIGVDVMEEPYCIRCGELLVSIQAREASDG